MAEARDSRVIKAGPEKDFFIEMLVKDIPLVRAIIDLVDNCVDGAIRLLGTGPYDGLEVEIQLTDDRITISDNCGGIPVDVAREYAFRFGRREGTPFTPGSVGHVGVGMKRAFFKLGNRFRVESTAQSSHFVVDEDVSAWRAQDEWEFTFDVVESHLPETDLDERRTIVTVTELHESVANSFQDETFRASLRRELAAAQELRLEQGLRIVLNDTPLEMQPLTLYQSDEIKPAHWQTTIHPTAESPVTVEVYAGIDDSEPSDAGWYVFCNGRMVLQAEQTNTTGWGEGQGKRIPKYHNQFAMFRGYAFFACKDASLLPWNTTKTDVDADSPDYRAVRLQMIALMRPVIDFLNKLDAEKDLETDERPLTAAVEHATSAAIAQLEPADSFVAPEPPPRPALPRKGRIQYSKPVEQINVIKKVLGVSTYVDVGEMTFDYFFERECED